MSKRNLRAALAACVGGLLLTAASAPQQLGATISAVAPDFSEPSPEISFAPVIPTAFPGSDSPLPEPSAAKSLTVDPAPELADPAEPREWPAAEDLGELDTETAEPATRNAAGAALSADEMHCLAVAVYHEARGEPRDGQLAVAQVVLNRAKSGRFPKTICGVVLQPAQFSSIRRNWNPRSSAAWREAQAIAADAAEGERLAHLGDALYFHATYVAPGWRGKARLARIGNHVFYR